MYRIVYPAIHVNVHVTVHACESYCLVNVETWRGWGTECAQLACLSGDACMGTAVFQVLALQQNESSQLSMLIPYRKCEY